MLLDELPQARAAAAAAVDQAQAELAARRAELDAAEAAVSEARNAEETAAARRRVVHAGDRASTAEKRLAEASGYRERVERDAAAAVEEEPRLAAEAASLAERLARVERVSREARGTAPDRLGPLTEWAARAVTGAFVARSGLEREREHVIREANELASAALGEAVAAASVALVRERLERALG